VGYEGGINLYGYAADDPINRTDPRGESDINLTHTRFDDAYTTGWGDHFDMFGTVTVFSHGSPVAIRTGPDNYAYPDEQTMAGLINSRELSAQPVALLGCRIGGDGHSYMQRLSRLLGRPVMGSTSRTWPDREPGGWYTLRAFHADSHHHRDRSRPGEFVVAGGTWANYGVEVPDGWHVRSIGFNPRAHRMRVTMDRTGSRIPRVVEREYGAK
jgi:hypothetical protein